MLSQRRPVGTSQKSSDGKVSGFVISNKEGSSLSKKCSNEWRKNLYIVFPDVVIFPIVVEFGRLTDNFHNYQGTYIFQGCLSKLLSEGGIRSLDRETKIVQVCLRCSELVLPTLCGRTSLPLCGRMSLPNDG